MMAITARCPISLWLTQLHSARSKFSSEYLRVCAGKFQPFFFFLVQCNEILELRIFHNSTPSYFLKKSDEKITAESDKKRKKTSPFFIIIVLTS